MLDWMRVFPFLQWVSMVDSGTIKKDLAAGLTGAVIVLPQGVAFASIAGLPPQYGLYTAMVTPVVAAFFGSSLHLVSGPTTAISIVIFSSVSNYSSPGSPEFISQVLTITFLAGVFQLLFGLAKLGNVLNFVSHTVVAGFTSGAALLIATSQMRHVLGTRVAAGGSFLDTWAGICAGIAEVNPQTLGIALVTIFSALAVRKISGKCPYLLVGMVVGGGTALLLGGPDAGIRMVGEIPSRLPPLSFPDLSPGMIRLLAPEAVAVAILGLVEAVSISRAIAVKSDQQIDACQEFIGQGVSNIAGSFFSSYAGSGSFTRSGVNYEAGAKTPLSAVFAALFLGAVVLVVAPLAAFLPVSAMGGVILLVAYNLIDFQYVAGLLRCSKVETVVFGVTFLATLLLELEFAVFLGVFISIAFVLAKTAAPNVPVISVDQTDPHRTLVDVESRLVRQCPQLRMIRVDGPVYFGSINHIQSRIRHIVEKEKVYNILVICSGVGFMDLNGEEVLIKESDNVKRLGGSLFFSGLRSDVYEFAVQSGFIRQIGPSNFFDSKEQALHEIHSRMDGEKCRICSKGVFLECGAGNRSRFTPKRWKAKAVKPVMLVPAGERK